MRSFLSVASCVCGGVIRSQAFSSGSTGSRTKAPPAAGRTFRILRAVRWWGEKAPISRIKGRIQEQEGKGSTFVSVRDSAYEGGTLMKRESLIVVVAAAVCVVALLAPAPGAGQTGKKPPPPQLLIQRVDTDFALSPSLCVMTIHGRNFGGDEPDVILDGTQLVVQGYTPMQVVAEFDCASAPGDYLLVVRRGPSQTGFDAISLTIGAMGPIGPTGATGPQGIQGRVGPTGATGPQGIQGPTSPTGPRGPTGDEGDKGDGGDAGLPGPTGATGPTGSYAGSRPDLPCFSGIYRWQDCGNGTVTDQEIGLIWLKDADCLGKTTWSAANDLVASLGDGTHLACNLSDGSSPGDWRLPNRWEWEVLVDHAHRLGCYYPSVMDTWGRLRNRCWSEGDPFFSVRQDLPYRTATTYGDPWNAWYMDLDGGNTAHAPKSTSAYYVWPVRGVRGDLEKR